MARSGYLSRATAFSWARVRLVVNVVVTAGLAYALYRQFFVVNDLPTLYAGFRQNLPTAFPYWIALIAALMPVNLLLEAYKLRVALPQNLQATWRDTLGQVCAGIAVGLWTPGRVGEFAGRLARTRAEQRGAMLSATALGGIAQWAPLLVGGGAAVLLWHAIPSASSVARGTPTVIPSEAEGSLIGAASLSTYLESDLTFYLGAASIAVGMASALLFWNVIRVVRWVRGRTFPAAAVRLGRRFGLGALADEGFLVAFETQCSGLLAASVGRYLVYLFQMSAAFVAFGLPTSLFAAIAGTAALLLLHGFLPVPPALQAVARIEFALLLFSYCQPNEVSIAGASLFVFALNLGLPALAGWLFIVRRNDATLSP